MIHLEDYGFNPSYLLQQSQEELAAHLPARIIAVHRDFFKAICEHGEVSAKVRSSAYYQQTGNQQMPTVGDFVLLQYNHSGESLIAKTLPRKTMFSRSDPDVGRGEQVLAANFDYVFILTSLNQDYNPKRLARYLVSAWNSGGIPVVLLTKADLTPDHAAMVQETQAAAPGAFVFAVSAQSGLGLDALRDFLQPGKTAVLLGSSGVGKSSLVNALAGQQLMPVNTIRENDAKGRHTTTHRQLLQLPGGALVIDTPGMRSLGLWVGEDGIDEAYSDITQLFARCRYRNCSHNGEQGCAVQAALDDGTLTQTQWEHYNKLLRELRHSETKQARKTKGPAKRKPSAPRPHWQDTD